MDLKEKMLDFVTKNIWCSPKQDRQAILKLARLTEFGGSRHRFSYGWTNLTLPTDDAPYHVYEIGQNCPVELGLFPQRGTWISLANLCTTQGMVADLYLNNGIQIPRNEAYICRTHDKSFVLCVKEVLKISDLNREDLNLRIYTDAYFGSLRSNGSRELLVCRGGLMKTVADINALQAEIQDIKPKVGYVNIWHNGRYVNNVSAAKVKPGDYVEYFYDPSIAAVIDFPMSSLPSFTSSLDNLAKFILHPPKRGDEGIYFRDDIDIFLIKKETNGNYDGLYYHRNRENSLRMLTHRDYSIPSTYVKGFVKDDAVWQNDASDLIVRVQVRESGYDRPLVHEANRIHEMYKLSDKDILRALQGLDSVLKEWTADWLEASLYTYLMSCWYHELNADDSIKALGHNSMTEIVGQTPQRVIHLPGGFNYVELPWGLQLNSTVYEYDADGLLLGWYRHTSGARYYPRNSKAELVEGISGEGTQNVEAYYGKVDLTLDTMKSYRFYISDVRNSATKNNWREITADDGFFKVVDGKVEWLYDESRKVVATVTDSKFLAYRLVMQQDDGFFRFHLNYTDVQGVVMELPVGKIELWLNEHSLIPNLDFFYNYPEIVVVNKEWLNPTGENNIDIRCTDWAQADGTMRPSADYGFIQHGVLSNDQIYQIRDDHVIRVVADGRTFHRDDLVFAEQRYGVRVKESANVEDGRPYWISDVHVPLPGIKDYDADALRSEAEDLDKRVGDYLTTKLTPPEFTDLATTKWRYRLFSPLITKLISDIQRGWFSPPQMPAPDQTVMESLKEYEYILEYEPTRNGVDLEYVTVHPHPWVKTRTVTISQYLYLERICQLYLSGAVDLTQFVTIKG